MAEIFNATTSKIESTMTTLDDFTQSTYSIICWIKPNSSGEGGSGRILNAYDSSEVSKTLFFGIDESGADMDLQFISVTSGTNISSITTNREIQESVWNLAGVTGNAAATPVLYVDGSTVTQTDDTPSGTVDSVDGIMRTGNNDLSSRTYDGSLYLFVIWSVVLGANEINAMFNGVHPFGIRGGNLLFFQPLDGNDSTEPDYTGNAQLGTITGTTKAATNPPIELMENYL